MPKTPNSAPAGKPKPKRKRKPKNTCTALVLYEAQVPQPKKTPAAKYLIAMNKMLRALEVHHGNISAATTAARVSRRAHYRWMKGDTPARRRYQRRALEIFNADLIVDKAISVVGHHLDENNLTAAMFTLNMRGQKAGYNSKEQPPPTPEAITKLLEAFQSVLRDNPNMTDTERAMWIKDFAASGGIPEETLVRRIKVLELTGGKG